MAADVSSVARMLRGYEEEGEGKRDLVTRDLLGGGAVLGAAEVDLEIQVPHGWERRLDLLSGRTFLQRRDSDPATSRPVHDLNLPPPLPAAATASDLRRESPLSRPRPAPAVSVCTLEHVKLALERVDRESRLRHPASGGAASPPASSSTTSSSAAGKRPASPAPAPAEEVAESAFAAGDGGVVAAGCPNCLLYVLISRLEPKCPRCDSHVPMPVPVPPLGKKRPKFDLNVRTKDNDEDDDDEDDL